MHVREGACDARERLKSALYTLFDVTYERPPDHSLSLAPNFSRLHVGSLCMERSRIAHWLAPGERQPLEGDVRALRVRERRGVGDAVAAHVKGLQVGRGDESGEQLCRSKSETKFRSGS